MSVYPYNEYFVCILVKVACIHFWDKDVRMTSSAFQPSVAEVMIRSIDIGKGCFQ